ncbi:DUF4345 domain-containing protein [Afifella marina]|uniref:DUF4345 domain-containing protein n=1 Tax=Afifella marina DSM 2698 TaxID=1120955 RepID=A0A1G5MIK1_AFIMA|nr:DUF4345 domain-containing protein [Afifella marina]MBK1623762.1 DUF4345 domain-containing protein [Afifella marina DSM 2698]MBK1627322.1 DUF4345 domain-containing protein [Afifella marina]MBK5918649.1 hypothetical protein [Afifella marina]RAI22729.1 hypothetical protein CH311_03440 [Afifella marina DSM 2698]SCZ24902.1 protein of unknown function [Afifella marina DSM 2698]
MPTSRERLLLQIVVAILSLIPLSAGAACVVLGPGFLQASAPWPVDLDSHLRFLSGVFFGVGLAFLSCVPAIERKGERFRLLSMLIVLGGLARLLSLVLAGSPSPGHVGGLVMELAVVPCLVVWQRRVARLRSRTGSAARRSPT